MSKKSYTPDESLGFLLGKAYRSIGSLLNHHFREAGHSITTEQWLVLTHLWREDGINQQDLSSRCCRDKASMARIIKTMERGNLLIRIPDKTDRRNKKVYLTNRGEALRDDLIAQAVRTLQEAQQGIPEEDLNTCKRVLRQVYDNIQQVRSEQNNTCE